MNTETENVHYKRMRFWFKLSIQILILFVCAMMWSYVTDTIQQSGFFADTFLGSKVDDNTKIDPHWSWGVRHYWWFWMWFVMFIMSIVRISMWGDWYWSENNKKIYK